MKHIIVQKMKSFLRGFSSINLFPVERLVELKPVRFKIISDQEAFQKDLEQIGKDVYQHLNYFSHE